MENKRQKGSNSGKNGVIYRERKNERSPFTDGKAKQLESSLMFRFNASGVS